MNVVSRILMCLAAIALCSAHGAVEQMNLRHERDFTPVEDLQTEEPFGFWERFTHAFDDRADENFTDRLHPLKVMGWSFKRPDDSWSQIRERSDSSVRAALQKSIEYSLRDALVGSPLLNWLEARGDALANLFVDTVDAVEEEAVSPVNPLYQPAERLWWQNVAEKRTFRAGVRPFRADPYTFLSVRVQDGDRPLLMGHVRYFFRNFADHKFELAMSLPLPHGFEFDVGTAYQFGQHDEQKKIALKLFKPLKNGGIVHVGVELQRSPTVFAGISLPL